MLTTYYINSATGSDANAGTSIVAPFQSLVALNNLVLHPGDAVLLARGTSYASQLTVKYSGTADTPITFGAYGLGNAPVINGPATGVYSSGTHDIVVHDIAIAHTSGYAIFGGSVSNWTVDNIAISNTGTATHSGAVSFENSTGVTITNSSISGVTGDGVLINGGSGITIAGNQVTTVQGQYGDNVQVNNATNVTVTGNHLDMSAPTNSTKGNLVVNSSNSVDIEHNTLVGGMYGASVNSNNVTIASNEISGQKGYSWSFGIGIGENWNVQNYNIHDNNIHNVPWGVAITGTLTTVDRYNIDVHNNTFNHIANAALKVDRYTTGDFINNEIGSDSTPTQISAWIAATGKFIVSGNLTFTSSTSGALFDLTHVSASETLVGSHLVSNDASVSGETLINGKAIGGGLSVAGRHGAVSIDAAGNFVYRHAAGVMAGTPGHSGTLGIAANGELIYADSASKVDGGGGNVHDAFMHKVSDGSVHDDAGLSLAIDPHTDFHI